MFIRGHNMGGLKMLFVFFVIIIFSHSWGGGGGGGGLEPFEPPLFTTAHILHPVLRMYVCR